MEWSGSHRDYINFASRASLCEMLLPSCVIRDIKSVRGLTQARGVIESTLTIWMYGTPFTFVVLKAVMDEFLGTTSESHVEFR